MTTSTNPIRTPDTTSPRIMTNRGAWLVVLNVLFPGSVQAIAGNRRLGRVGLASTMVAWVFVIILVVLNSLAQTFVLTLATNPFFLVLTQIALVYYAILWVVLTLDTLRLVRIVKTGPRARYWLPSLAIVMVAILAGGSVYASTLAGGVTRLVSDLGVAGPAVEPVDGHYNFIVLGVDGDRKRSKDGLNLRPDSMQVVSVDAKTGKIFSFSFPRDLHNIPFPASSPMHKIYPDGYTESSADYCTEWACLNTVYVDAELNHADLYPQAKKLGVSPGVFAMMDAAEGITGLKIQFYALADMQGLVSLIDALGGVDIDVPYRVGLANMDVPDSEVRYWIPAGQQHLDGWHALMFARSRHAPTGDYERMKRQQLLMAALQKQMNPMNVLAKFQEVSKTGGRILKTNIPQPMFGTLAEIAMKARKAGYTGVAFTPYSDQFKIYPHDPSFSKIKMYIQSLMNPPTPSPTPSN